MAISLLRRKAIERKNLPDMAPLPEKINSPEDEVNSKQLTEILRYYVSQLPEHLRHVVVLRDFAEMSYFQIGQIVGISSATARVYRYKAVQLLAAWMNKEKGHKQ